jgi:N utilization substance protein A
MKSEFLIALNQLSAERNLSHEVVLEAVKGALLSAYKRDFGTSENIIVKLDPSEGRARVFALKTVVDEVSDEEVEISLAQAREIDPEAQLDEVVEVEVTPPTFGRIGAQTAKQVILQRIREAERDVLYLTYADQEGETVAGTVQAIEPHSITLGLGKAEAILPRSEQVPGERYYVGQRLRAYVYEVQKTGRGPQILVTRASRRMLRRLLELEVPEIFNGIVEMKAIAREAGSRSKVAVSSIQEGVDPVGACVGMRGIRIQNIVNELNGEKIDVVAWDTDPRVFIGNALSPAQVADVELYPDDSHGKTAIVVVPDGQLSLAIGKQGQNARLAAKLTGWRIDIKSATEAARLALLRAKEEAAARVISEAWLAREEALKASLALLAKEPAAEEPLPEAEPAAVPGGEGPEPEMVEGEQQASETEEFTGEPVAEEADTAETEDVLPVAVEEGEAPEEHAPERPVEVEELPQDYEDGEEEDDEELALRGGRKDRRRGRTLVYDEELDEVVAERSRKPGRSQRDWREELREWQRRRDGE